MYVDPITRADLSIFHAEEKFAVFHCLNFTRTDGGREKLCNLFEHPLSDRTQIEQRQLFLSELIGLLDQWPMRISNGTLHAVEKWMEYPLDPITENPASLSNLLYRWLHPADHSMLRYSLPHLIDLVQGCDHILRLVRSIPSKHPLQPELIQMERILKKSPLHKLVNADRTARTPLLTALQWARITRYVEKESLQELLQLYYLMDAWYSMARATQELKLTFPTFRESDTPYFQVKQLTHIQLNEPVGYDLQLDTHHRLLFLTGANMAGKSTLIKSIGIAVYLAHLGMGVPAQYMELSVFDGLLSNVTIADNVVRGESYFFNEVQRIKKTLAHMMDGRRWLVLIDELFKGTNVEDARRCSLAVIEGIVQLPQTLTLLSTHLYEIGESLTKDAGILFRYFETEVRSDELHFSYQLKEGISEDRIGFRILEREGVVDLLKQIPRNIEG
ncbi:MAG: MutS-related protein [Bacteroidota bacterium]